MERGAVEREVKLEAGVGFRMPDLDGVAPGLTVRSDPEQRLQAVYVDTPDLRLIRGGLTLRHRSERRPAPVPGEWTLKFPETSTSPGLSRREINWPGPWGAVPAEVSGLVRAYRRTAPLGPVARLVTHRRRTVVVGRSGEALLEIDDDVVSVMDGRRLAARFREVEVEVVGAAPDWLVGAVVARLGEAGAIAGDGRSKVVRAIGPRATEPPDVNLVPVDRNSTIGEVVRAAIAHGYLRLVAHDLGVRLDEDPEDVHQARVATRRLRSDLRTFRAYLPEDWAQEIRAELGWVAEALGRARDADVLFERLHGQVDTLDGRDAQAAGLLLGQLVAEQAAARDALLKVLDTHRYGVLLDRLAAAAQELPPTKAPGDTLDGPVPVPAVAGSDPAPDGGAEGLAPGTATEGVGEAATDEPGPALADQDAAAGAAAGGAPEAAPVALEPAVLDPDVPAAGAPEAARAALGPAVLDRDVPAAGAPEAARAALGPAVLDRDVPAAGAPEAARAAPGPAVLDRDVPAAGAPEAARAAHGPAVPDRDATARHEAPAIVWGPWRHLSRAVRALGAEPSDEALHEVRIRAKRLRYASEAVAPAVGKPAVVLARAAADLQGVLGDFHDAIVAEVWLRTATEGASPAQALAAGQLIARERDDAARCRAIWHRAWKGVNRKKRRAWLT